MPAGPRRNPGCRAFHRPDFSLLRCAERELGTSTERFPNGEYRFDAWYWAMDRDAVEAPGSAMRKRRSGKAARAAQVLWPKLCSAGRGLGGLRGEDVRRSLKILVFHPLLDSCRRRWKTARGCGVIDCQQEDAGAGGRISGGGRGVARDVLQDSQFLFTQWGGSFADVDPWWVRLRQDERHRRGYLVATLYTDTFVGSSRIPWRQRSTGRRRKAFRMPGKPGTDGCFQFSLGAWRSEEASGQAS